MISGTPLLGSILASFFNDYLKLQRGLRPNSITSYADAMRLFLQFAAATSKKKITHLGLDDLEADVVSQFLTSLEERRSNAPQSRNQRLAALRTFFEYIGHRFPERLGQAQKIAAIPRKRAQLPEIIFLERDEKHAMSTSIPTREYIFTAKETNGGHARFGRKQRPCSPGCWRNKPAVVHQTAQSSRALRKPP